MKRLRSAPSLPTSSHAARSHVSGAWSRTLSKTCTLRSARLSAKRFTWACPQRRSYSVSGSLLRIAQSLHYNNVESEHGQAPVDVAAALPRGKAIAVVTVCARYLNWQARHRPCRRGCSRYLFCSRRLLIALPSLMRRGNPAAMVQRLDIRSEPPAARPSSQVPCAPERSGAAACRPPTRCRSER